MKKEIGSFFKIKSLEMFIFFILGIYFTYLAYESITSLQLFSSLIFLIILIVLATFFAKTFYQLKYIKDLVSLRDRIAFFYREHLNMDKEKSFNNANNIVKKKKSIKNLNIPEDLKKELEKLL
jgi:predicted membrane protein